MLALAHKDMWQSAIVGRVGLTHATTDRNFWRHAATGILVPGKSTGALRKTTPHRNCALLRMVWQDCFISARALTARMRNLNRISVGRHTTKNRLLSRGYRAYKPTSKPLLTAKQRHLCLELAVRWQNLTVAHWQHVIVGDESDFNFIR